MTYFLHQGKMRLNKRKPYIGHLNKPYTIDNIIKRAINESIEANKPSLLIVHPSIFIDQRRKLPVFNVTPYRYKQIIGEPPEEVDVDYLIERLSKSNRNVIVMGAGCRSFKYPDYVKRLAKKIGAVVVCTMGGIGLKTGKERIDIGMIGGNGSDQANYALVNGDNIFWIGSSVRPMHVSLNPRLFYKIKKKSIQLIRGKEVPSYFSGKYIRGSIEDILPELNKNVISAHENQQWMIPQGISYSGVEQQIPETLRSLVSGIIRYGNEKMHITYGCGVCSTIAVPILVGINGGEPIQQVSASMKDLAGWPYRGANPVLITGDGEIVMDPSGSLGVMKDKSVAKRPLKVFIIYNGEYGYTNDLNIGKTYINLSAKEIIKMGNIKNSYLFRTKKQVEKNIQNIMETKEHTLVVLDISHHPKLKFSIRKKGGVNDMYNLRGINKKYKTIR